MNTILKSVLFNSTRLCFEQTSTDYSRNFRMINGCIMECPEPFIFFWCHQKFLPNITGIFSAELKETRSAAFNSPIDILNRLRAQWMMSNHLSRISITRDPDLQFEFLFSACFRSHQTGIPDIESLIRIILTPSTLDKHCHCNLFTDS